MDRVASAWLMRRFIGPKARCLWLKHVKNRPKQAVRFDFDGAELTHVDSKVTFEVLLASFGLEQDALEKVGGLGSPHLDLGCGFATPRDDAMLRVMTPVLANLYAGIPAPVIT